MQSKKPWIHHCENIMAISYLDIGRKLNVHTTFRRRPGRALNVLYTFNLRLVPRGYKLKS